MFINSSRGSGLDRVVNGLQILALKEGKVSEAGQNGATLNRGCGRCVLEIYISAESRPIHDGISRRWR